MNILEKADVLNSVGFEVSDKYCFLRCEDCPYKDYDTCKLMLALDRLDKTLLINNMNENIEFTREEVEKMLMHTNILIDLFRHYLRTSEEQWKREIFERELLSIRSILEFKYERL